MRKFGIAMFCIALCLAVALIFPQAGKTNEMVTTVGCLECHVVGPPSQAGETIHGKHTSASCDKCHEGGYAADTVAASTCSECHPFGDAGNCPLVNFHDPDKGTDCLLCHSECEEEDPTTTTTIDDETTTTTTTSENTTCFATKIYGEGSDEVLVMRYLRNNVLRKSPEGQGLIRLYYRWSPVIAKAIENDEEFKEKVKEMIDGFLLLTTKKMQ